MPLLDSVLEHACEIDAGDIHLISPRGQEEWTVVYRRQRKTIHTAQHKAQEWSSLLEQIKFQSGYRSEKRLEFQDALFLHGTMAFRVAFTPYPCDYVTLRRHDLQRSYILPSCLKKESFLQKWQQDSKVLLIAGGLHSGKTTLYYDILQKSVLQAQAVLSLEDPIERPIKIFFQLPYNAVRSQDTASSLVRFDPDLVGLGELRRDTDWGLLHFLSLSSIRTLSTCHAASLEALSTKVRTATMQNPALKEQVYGAIFLDGRDFAPRYYLYESLKDAFILV